MIISIDIETIRSQPEYSILTERQLNHWRKKVGVDDDHLLEEKYYSIAGYYPEFSKVVCISCTLMDNNDNLKTKSYYGGDEVELLRQFAIMCDKINIDKFGLFVGHNLLRFDIPFLIKRFIINGLQVPRILLHVIKSKDKLCDLMDMWKFGGTDTSGLSLLCDLMDVPIMNDNVDGSMISNIFWVDNDVDKIVAHCEQSTKSMYLLYKRIMGSIQ